MKFSKREKLQQTSRRDFCRGLALGAVSAPFFSLRQVFAQTTTEDRPNILWLVSEDNSPFLGCYGDSLADTPILDRMASEGILYRNAHSGAPVCAPARCTLITAMEPPAIWDALPMRSRADMPEGVRAFPTWLREAGYYCTNNAKTDYNIKVDMKATWDESSKKAHYKNRPDGQPFFAVFNCHLTHESKNFRKKDDAPKGWERFETPKYHPESETFKIDRAHYYQQVSRMDGWVGKHLKALDEAGLAEDTIVFYYSDHGGVLPRSKRFLYHSGTNTALIVRFPEKYRHLAPAKPGEEVVSPVSFADFGPTVLSLAGIKPHSYMHGRPFAGVHKAPDRKYVYCYRGRMDERYDFSRAVKTKQFSYMRNYMPHLIYGQHVEYMFRQLSMKEWKKLFDAGALNEVQSRFFRAKPAEELYDFTKDPDEVVNLVDDPAFSDVLEELRQENKRHMLEIRDSGFAPEDSGLDLAGKLDDPSIYNLERYIDMADVVTARKKEHIPQLQDWLKDQDQIMRYWASMGLLMLGKGANVARVSLLEALKDPFEIVRIPAAEALFLSGDEEVALEVLEQYAFSSHPAQLHAVSALDRIGEGARRLVPKMQELYERGWPMNVKKVLGYALENLNVKVE